MDYLSAGGQPTDKLINFAADDGATADRVAGGGKGGKGTHGERDRVRKVIG